MDKQKIKDYLNPKNWIEKAKYLFKRTSAEIVVGAVIGALALGGASYNHERLRENKIPLAFSEKTQIMNDARTNGETVGPITNYLTSANDAVMKVFECWNMSRESPIKDINESFATELEIKIDPSLNHHHFSLDSLLKSIPSEADSAIAGIDSFIRAGNSLRTVNQNFDNAWNDEHDDDYRTEVYFTTDEKGNSEMHTRQVYDHTHHTYDYSKSDGELASVNLDKTLKEFPELRIEDKLPTASQTNAEGEYAIEKTNKLKGSKDNERMSRKDLLFFASTWNHGSTFRANLNEIRKNWDALPSDNRDWAISKNTAKSDAYVTHSHYDPGPAEFQVAERALSHGTDFVKNVDEIVSVMNYTKGAAQKLNREIEQLISVELDRRPKYSDLTTKSAKLAEEIMKDSKKIYMANFKKGLEVNRMRWYMLLTFILAGAVGGGGVGIAFDKYGKYNRREE